MDNLTDTELVYIGRQVRDTFVEIVFEERKAKHKSPKRPNISGMLNTPEFLKKIGRIVAQHEQDPVRFAATVRRVLLRNNNKFYFNMYGSPATVARALKEAEYEFEVVNTHFKRGATSDDVATKELPAELELVSRISVLKTFLYLRNKTTDLSDENIKVMSSSLMDLDSLACLILSRGESESIRELHYTSASYELSTRPDILAAVKKLKLNWKGLLD